MMTLSAVICDVKIKIQIFRHQYFSSSVNCLQDIYCIIKSERHFEVCHGWFSLTGGILSADKEMRETTDISLVFLGVREKQGSGSGDSTNTMLRIDSWKHILLVNLHFSLFKQIRHWHHCETVINWKITAPFFQCNDWNWQSNKSLWKAVKG